MSRASTRRRAEALDQRAKRHRHDERTLRTGVGLSRRTVSLLLLAVAAAVATWFFAVRPVGVDRAAVDARIEEVARQNSSLTGRIEAARAGEPDVLASLEARVRDADTLLPPPISSIAALDLLLPHAQRYGVSVTINPSTVTPPAPPGAAPQALTVKFTGNPQAVRTWLGALDELQPMATVSSVSLRYAAEGATGSVDVALWGATTPPLTRGTGPGPAAVPPVPSQPGS